MKELVIDRSFPSCFIARVHFFWLESQLPETTFVLIQIF